MLAGGAIIRRVIRRGRKEDPTTNRRMDKIWAGRLVHPGRSPATLCTPHARCRNSRFAALGKTPIRTGAPRCTPRRCRGVPSFCRYLLQAHILAGSKRSSKSPFRTERNDIIYRSPIHARGNRNGLRQIKDRPAFADCVDWPSDEWSKQLEPSV